MDLEIRLLRKFRSEESECFAHPVTRHDELQQGISAAWMAFENKIAAGLLDCRAKGALDTIFPIAVIGQDTPVTLFCSLAEGEDPGLVDPPFLIAAQSGGELADESSAVPEAIGFRHLPGPLQKPQRNLGI